MSEYLSARQLKEQTSLVDLLSRLGYKAVRKYRDENMYISMLRDNDTSPSFTVNDELGVWFDHGLRKGGNIIDFGLAYWNNLNFNQVVEKIQDLCTQYPGKQRPRPRKAIKLPHYIIERVNDIGTRTAITDYLRGRGVYEVARLYLSEVSYFVENDKGERKNYFAAGWQNENKGWEVRNKYFKGCLGSKAISVIGGHQKNVSIFEGFINFLSWKTENPGINNSIIVLNTLSLLKQGIESARAFSSIDLYFDRDQAGFGATKDFIRALPYATDRSSVFEGYNDYNDKLVASVSEQAALKNQGKNFFSSVQVPFRR